MIGLKFLETALCDLLILLTQTLLSAYSHPDRIAV